ncbi:hypothetical protein SUGI_1133960 [Cryptomeria japonica]|nr:hypothetical protein SUGI_1133960 [Cryptomeria japonica]
MGKERITLLGDEKGKGGRPSVKGRGRSKELLGNYNRSLWTLQIEKTRQKRGKRKRWHEEKWKKRLEEAWKQQQEQLRLDKEAKDQRRQALVSMDFIKYQMLSLYQCLTLSTYVCVFLFVIFASVLGFP